MVSRKLRQFPFPTVADPREAPPPLILAILELASTRISFGVSQKALVDGSLFLALNNMVTLE